MLLDHILVFALVVLLPLKSWYEMRKLRQQMAGRIATERETLSEYRTTMLVLWGFCIATLVLWFAMARSAETLGLGAGSGSMLRWVIGLALAGGGIVYTYWQTRLISKDEKARAEVRKQFCDLSIYLPKSRRELRRFNWLSLTAGITEEILFRGYLIWYAALAVGTIPALILSSVAFGACHAYQGAGNALRCGIVGLWMGTIYLITGSLWVPMVTHFVVDVIGGQMLYRTFAGTDSTTNEGDGKECLTPSV